MTYKVIFLTAECVYLSLSLSPRPLNVEVQAIVKDDQNERLETDRFTT